MLTLVLYGIVTVIMESPENLRNIEIGMNETRISREFEQSTLARIGNIATNSMQKIANKFGIPLLTASLLLGTAIYAETPTPNSVAYAQEPAPIIGPPFYGPSTLGHTYRSRELSPNANSYDDMIAYYGDAFYHPYPAIDFKMPRGRAIRAVTNGVVSINSQETDENPDAWPRRPGRFVLLDPDDPSLPFFAFKHLDSSSVTEGQRVTQGQIIGRAGSTQSPNVHLHFDAHNSVEGFNTYPEQADYGRIRFWQCGNLITLNSATARMDRRINPQPTRAASIRNCDL